MTNPTPPPPEPVGDQPDLPPPPKPDPRLTSRQVAFVSAFADCRNGAEAARRAGFSCRDAHAAATTAARLMSNDVIREAIRTALDHAWSAEACSRAERIALLSKLARGQSPEPNGMPPTIAESLTALRILAQMDPVKILAESRISYVVPLPPQIKSVEEWAEHARQVMTKHDPHPGSDQPAT